MKDEIFELQRVSMAFFESIIADIKDINSK